MAFFVLLVFIATGMTFSAVGWLVEALLGLVFLACAAWVSYTRWRLRS